VAPLEQPDELALAHRLDKREVGKVQTHHRRGLGGDEKAFWE
jgi:hypothetical protein